MKRSLSLIILVILSVATLSVQVGTAQVASGWLASNVNVKKLADLPDNTQPFSMGVDCTPTDFKIGFNNDGQQLHGCAHETLAGTIANNYILKGDHGTLPLNLHSSYGMMTQSPPASSTVVMLRSVSTSFTGLGMFVSTYEPTQLRYVTQWGVPMVYEYQYQPVNEKTVTDARGTAAVLANSLAYSQNGSWLVALRADGAIERFDTTTWQAKVIAWDRSVPLAETGASNLAVSNDGRFIAINPYANGQLSSATLKIYDATTCQDLSSYTVNQNGRPPNNIQQCTYQDIWSGGLKAQLQTTEYPRHLRFIGENALTFDMVHDRLSSNSFKVSSYLATNGDYVPQTGALLGMGDSYISGEGAFGYRSGTDTDNNKCHTSIFSYPYVIGTKLFSDFNSVACSGAKMNDVDTIIHYEKNSANSPDSYKGQVKDEKPWVERSDTQNEIIDEYLPGYANQILFSDKYKPKNVLISIGGNDIHFGDIVKSCVSPQSIETCYGTYDSRRQLMQSVVDRYDDLVAMYETVAQSSGGNVYVVGYPQIAKPFGDCGANVYMNSDEVLFSAMLVDYIDSVIQRAASDAGVVYVDTQNALYGYRLCEAPSGKAAMNGFTVGRDSGVMGAKFIGQESYHPTAFGHQLLANAILAKTNNLTRTMPLKPTKYGKPSIDPNDPLLQTVPLVNYTPRTLIWMPTVNTTHVLTKGAKYTFNGATNLLKTKTPFSLVIHSTPIVLSEGSAGEAESTVRIPTDIETGFHTLDLYGEDENGQQVDIRQIVYVGSPEELLAPCMGLSTTGKDTDGDGVDDACDGVLDDSSVPIASRAASTDEPGSMLQPFVEESAEYPENTEQETRGGSQAANVTLGLVIQPNITQYLQNPESNADEITDDSRVLGKETTNQQTNKKETAFAVATPNVRSGVPSLVLGILVVGVLLASVVLTRKYMSK